MAGYYSPHASIFDSDAYGVDTDNPPSPYEKIDNALTVQCEIAIADGFKQWLKDTAYEYFDTSDWDEEWRDAWRDKIMEII